VIIVEKQSSAGELHRSSVQKTRQDKANGTSSISLPVPFTSFGMAILVINTKKNQPTAIDPVRPTTERISASAALVHVHCSNARKLRQLHLKKNAPRGRQTYYVHRELRCSQCRHTCHRRRSLMKLQLSAQQPPCCATEDVADDGSGCSGDYIVFSTSWAARYMLMPNPTKKQRPRDGWGTTLM